jgi:hypothetical protein
MFNQYNKPTNYLTYDNSSLNQYNHKNLDNALPVYQPYQNLFYYNRQLNPTTLSNVNAQSRNHAILQTYQVIRDLLFMMVLMVFMEFIQ